MRKRKLKKLESETDEAAENQELAEMFGELRLASAKLVELAKTDFDREIEIQRQLYRAEGYSEEDIDKEIEALLGGMGG